MHQDHVTLPPPGFQILGFNHTSPVQIMMKDEKYLSYQGHPEYTNEYVKDLVQKRLEMGIFNKEFVDGLIFEECDAKWYADQVASFIQ